MHHFPKDFVFGASTSAYQIEGATREDGRGLIYWDVANEGQPEHLHVQTGDVACDHYHRYKDDVALMKKLGLQTYRFSISWVRLFPHGHGQPNPLGVAFYHHLIDELLAAGIEPAITIWHGDLPLDYDRIGGWANRDVIEYYLAYARFLFDTYGSKVKRWFTHNEPWCAAFLGDDDFQVKMQRSHHLLVAHARCVALYHLHPQGNGEIGIVLNLEPQYPATYSTKDAHAAQLVDGFLNRWFLDPVLKGSYPHDMLNQYRRNGYHLSIHEGDLELMKSYPGDFLGINVYSRAIQQFDPLNQLLEAKGVRNEQATYNEMGGEVCPESLYDLLHRIHREYDGVKIYITENGAAFKDDVRDAQGKVLDADRAQLIEGNIASVARAIDDGVNVAGYYVWSLMDNFEWGFGYTKFFGIIHVDYQTQVRTPKLSAEHYARIILAHRVRHQLR